MGAPFTIPAVVFEGVETGDKRLIKPGALTTRALPLTLMGMLVNPEMGGHGLAVVAGRIDTLTRVDAGSMIDESTGKTWGEVAGGEVFAWEATGEFADTEDGKTIQDLVASKTLRGISVDLAATEAEEVVLDEDEDGWPTDWLVTVTAGEIAAATVCNIPALKGSYITTDATADAPENADAVVAAATVKDAWRILADGPGCGTCPDDTATRAVTASGGPLRPPSSWFAAPDLDGPTPLTVTDTGRVFGHLAAWGTCHTGYPGQCVTPPKSATDYALFHLGAVRTAEGDDVAVGHITMGIGHAPTTASTSTQDAARHYDNTDAVVADVHAGEDAYGIWVSGAVRPTASDDQVRALRASKLSGDWRSYGGRLELLAALAVNVPGFPVPRAKLVTASGAPVALVAAGAASPRLAQSPDKDVDAGTVKRATAQLSRADQLRAAAAAGVAAARVKRADRFRRWQ